MPTPTTAFLLGWGSVGALGLLLLVDGLYSALGSPSSHAPSFFCHPNMVFGLCLAGSLLLLLSLPPLHAHFAAGSHKKKQQQCNEPPALPEPFAAVLARADDPGFGMEEAVEALQVDATQGLVRVCMHPPHPPYSHPPTHPTHTHLPPYRLYTIVARERLWQCGPNELDTTYLPTYLSIFFEELYEGPQLLLMGVGIAYALLGSTGRYPTHPPTIQPTHPPTSLPTIQSTQPQTYLPPQAKKCPPTHPPTHLFHRGSTHRPRRHSPHDQR